MRNLTVVKLTIVDIIPIRYKINKQIYISRLFSALLWESIDIYHTKASYESHSRYVLIDYITVYARGIVFIIMGTFWLVTHISYTIL